MEITVEELLSKKLRVSNDPRVQDVEIETSDKGAL